MLIESVLRGEKGVRNKRRMEQQKHLIDSLTRPESILDADSVEVAGQVCRLQRRRCSDPILL